MLQRKQDKSIAIESSGSYRAALAGEGLPDLKGRTGTDPWDDNSRLWNYPNQRPCCRTVFEDKKDQWRVAMGGQGEGSRVMNPGKVRVVHGQRMHGGRLYRSHLHVLVF